MTFLTRDQLLGSSDIREEEVALPSLGADAKVRVRTLPAQYANQAQSEALEMSADRHGRQAAKVNTGKLEALQVLHGLIEPKLNDLDEAMRLAAQVGPAWREIVQAIDRLSGIDKEAIEKANAAFPGGGQGEGRVAGGDESAGGDGGPDLSRRLSVASSHAGGGDGPPDVAA